MGRPPACSGQLAAHVLVELMVVRKWRALCPVFTVRDLAPLAPRWSRQTSEEAPSLQSPALSLFSSSILYFIQTPAAPPPPLASFHLPPVLNISFLRLLNSPPSPAPSVQPYFPFLLLCPRSAPTTFLPLLFRLAACGRGEGALSRGWIAAEGGFGLPRSS